MSLRNKIAEAYLGLGESFGRSISEIGLKIFLNSIADLPEQIVLDGIMRCALELKYFPSIAEIRHRANPSEGITDEVIANDTVSKVIQAMSKFGYTNSDKAKEFIGELGWELVTREGGWENVCRNVELDQLPIYRAQWRELIKAIILQAPNKKETKTIEAIKKMAIEHGAIKSI